MNPQTSDNCPYCKAKVYALPCEGDETTYWECGTDYVQEWGFARSSDCYEFELSEKTNEVARLRESLDRYEDIINKQDDELIRLREENAELKQGKVFVDPKWIYNLETQLAKAHEELCQAGLREYGI